MNGRLLTKILLLASLMWVTREVKAGITLTANGVGSQSTLLTSNVTTESFDGIAPGSYTTLNTSVGALSSPGLEIVAANQYGGAGGTGNFIAVGLESTPNTTMTLTLTSAQSYFGFWWSAADYENQMQFYSDGKLLGTFDGATASAALGAAYNGNPNPGGGDPSEPYAYINFFGTGGTTFDKIVFSNASAFTGFESDNWSIEQAPVDPVGTAIAGFTAVPEPSSLILSAMGLVACVGVIGRRRFTTPSSPDLL